MDLAQKGTKKKPGGRPFNSPTSTTTSGLVSKLTSLPSQQVGLGQRLQWSLSRVRVIHLYHLPRKGPLPGSWMAGGPVTSAPSHARPPSARPTLSCGAEAPTPTPAYIHTHTRLRATKYIHACQHGRPHHDGLHSQDRGPRGRGTEKQPPPLGRG